MSSPCATKTPPTAPINANSACSSNTTRPTAPNPPPPNPPKKRKTNQPEKPEQETLDIYMEDDTSPTGETFLFRFSGPPLPNDPRYLESTPSIHPPPATDPPAS